MNTLKGIGLLALFFVLIAVGFIVYHSIFRTVTAPLPRTSLRIGDRIFAVEIADTIASRTQGLSGRRSLASDAGMLFIFDLPDTHSFWMRGMEFPLDLIWVRNKRVVSIVENAPPDNTESPIIYTPKAVADAVLELNAGAVKALGIEVNDRVEYEL